MGRKAAVTTSGTGKKNRNRAFTLLEVLIALAILNTGLLLAAAAFSRHIRLLHQMDDSVTAREKAEESLIREALRRQIGPDALPDEDPADRFTQRLRLEPFPGQEGAVAAGTLDRATAEVSWDSRGQVRSERMEAGFSADVDVPS